MGTESAIQSDVQNATTTATTDAEPQKTAREQEMERIEQRHHQQMADEYGIHADDDAGTGTGTGTPPATTADDQLAAQMNDGEAAPGALPNKVKVKIDGTEAEVPLDEVIRNYQKTSAADRRIEEATHTRRALAEREAQIAAREAQIAAREAQLTQQMQPNGASAPAAATTTTTDAETGEPENEFLDALFSGDEETARAKLGELLKGRQQGTTPAQPTLDINELTEAVTAHVQQKLTVESALQKHRSDYPEIYADPDLEGYTLTKVNSLRAANPGLDFFTALNSASAELADKFGWKTSHAADDGRPNAAAPATTDTRAAKLERKQSIDTIQSANTKTTTTEQVPESVSDVIKQMQAARAGR